MSAVALVGRKIELLFDRFDLTRVVVPYQHRLFGTPFRSGSVAHPSAGMSHRHQCRQGSTT